jgi:hypothetical protein
MQGRGTMSDSDPRAENCRANHLTAAGKVDGVALEVSVRPLTRYRLARIELVDEVSAQGNCVATCRVLDADGLLLGDQVWLAWPWPSLTQYALPGNPNGQHPITNSYTPPNVGPLALCLRDAQGAIASDVVGGLGLPFGHHVSFIATWQKRGDGDTDEEGEETGGALVAAVVRCAVALERLAGHLGA